MGIVGTVNNGTLYSVSDFFYFSTHSSVVISQTQLPCDKVHFEHQEGFFHVEKPTKDILNFEELCQAKSLIYTDDTGKKFCFGKPELRKPEDKLTTGKCAALPPGEAEVTAVTAD